MAQSRVKDFSGALLGLEDALLIFQRAKEPFWVSRCHGEFAEIYLAQEESEKLLYWAGKALDYAELDKDQRWIYIPKYYLGFAHRLKGQLDQAESLLIEAKEVSRRVDDKSWKILMKIEKELAGIYSVTHRETLANETLRRSRTIEETLGDCE
jgi:tetratricopeptide (TPR) repeat protein